MLPDEVKQRSEKDQGPGTRLVLKGLNHALPSIAERNEQNSREREPAPRNGSGKGLLLISISHQEHRLCKYSTMLTHTLPGKPKHRPSKPKTRNSHKKAEETTSALIPYRKGTSSRSSHIGHENRHEERNRGEEIEEEMAPGMRASNSRSRQRSVGTHASKYGKGSPSRSTFSQRGFRDI